MILFFGSNPLAKNAAVVSLIFSFKILGSCFEVIACRSTTQYMHSLSCSLCKFTKFLIAPI